MDLEQGVEDAPQGEPGEIIIKSPLIMQGYWDNPEETAGQLKDGWLYTGDIAVRDEDDYFFIVDRKKDMIIAGGFNIYPREIDEILYQHPKVMDAASMGVPDEYRGETVKAFIVLRDEKRPRRRRLFLSARKACGLQGSQDCGIQKDAPKSAVGKVLRKVLRSEELAKKEKKDA